MIRIFSKYIFPDNAIISLASNENMSATYLYIFMSLDKMMREYFC